jgi:ubiquinone/menaquinone biosynthesis C-methylase UbiE
MITDRSAEQNARNDPLRNAFAARSIGSNTLAMVEAMQRAGFKVGMTVLDVGGGSGGSLVPFMQVGCPAGDLTCFDANPRCGEDIAWRFPGVHFVQGDATSLPFPDQHFDIVTSSGVFHEAEPDPDKVRAITAEMRRVCRGHLLINDWSFRMPWQKDRSAINRAWCRQMFGADVLFSSSGPEHPGARVLPIPLLWKALGRRVYVIKAHRKPTTVR